MKTYEDSRTARIKILNLHKSHLNKQMKEEEQSNTEHSLNHLVLKKTAEFGIYWENLIMLVIVWFLGFKT